MTDKSGQLKEAINVLKQHKSTAEKYNMTVGDAKVSEAIDTVVSHLAHLNTANKTGLYDILREKSIEQPDNQKGISNKKNRLYTAKDREAFAEWLIGRSADWITDEERCETAETFIEMWEKERGEK